MRFKYLFIIIVIIIILYQIIKVEVNNLNLENIPILSYTKIKTSKNFEPSGISINHINNMILVVSDNGKIGEIINEKFEKRKFNKRYKKDFEDLTFNPNSSDIYIIDEEKNMIYIFDKELKFYKKSKINRYYKNQKVLFKKGNGLESLSYVKEDENYIYFISANQSYKTSGKNISSILYLKYPKNTNEETVIYNYLKSDIKDISSIYYRNDFLLVISDFENKLYILNDKHETLKIYNLIGENQEGLTFDFINNIMYIAQDSGDILKIILNEDFLNFLR